MPQTVAPTRKRLGLPEPSPEQVKEQNRLARQEALFYDCTSPNAKLRQKLIDAMLQRAYDFMWDHQCEACDALTEWLPSDQVAAMFDAWWNDSFAKDDEPKSGWYWRLNKQSAPVVDCHSPCTGSDSNKNERDQREEGNGPSEPRRRESGVYARRPAPVSSLPRSRRP
jgi:hypothetical protein